MQHIVSVHTRGLYACAAEHMEFSLLQNALPT